MENELLRAKLSEYLDENQINEYLRSNMLTHFDEKEIQQRLSHWKGEESSSNELDNYKGYVYIIQEDLYGTYKIGEAKRYKDRLALFEVKLPYDFELIETYYVNDRKEAEKYLHNKFESYRLSGEWFELTEKELEAIQNDPDFSGYIINEREELG